MTQHENLTLEKMTLSNVDASQIFEDIVRTMIGDKYSLKEPVTSASITGKKKVHNTDVQLNIRIQQEGNDLNIAFEFSPHRENVSTRKFIKNMLVRGIFSKNEPIIKENRVKAEVFYYSDSFREWLPRWPHWFGIWKPDVYLSLTTQSLRLMGTKYALGTLVKVPLVCCPLDEIRDASFDVRGMRSEKNQLVAYIPRWSSPVLIDIESSNPQGKMLIESKNLDEWLELQDLKRRPTCPFCKNEIQENWVACPTCGVKLRDDTRIY